MRHPFFLLFAASTLLTPVAGVPTPAIAQVPGRGMSCQAIKPAVVTVYAGYEIGSGSIVSRDGLVLTNQHVVKDTVRNGSRQPIYVKLASGERYQGKLLRTDRRHDLALIQLDANRELPTVPLAVQPSLRSGQAVCAIGSPFGREGVLSSGTLKSVKGNGDLQSNLLLNPGNSGGPLLNARGEMIGVNKAILETPAGRNTGISFATSVQAIRNFIEQTRPGALTPMVARYEPQPPTIVAMGSPTLKQRSAPSGLSSTLAQLPVANNQLSPAYPQSGSGPNAVVVPTIPGTNPASTSAPPEIVFEVPVTPPAPPPVTETGVQPEPPRSGVRLGVVLDVRTLMVQRVESGSAAALSGLRPGDRLIAINGVAVERFEEVQAFLQTAPDSAVFTVNRAQGRTTVRVNF